jgi:16S rRNA (guanine527-N7)-methyltransferase
MTLEDAHRQLLERWRTKTNLVGPGPIAAHFDDCKAALAPVRPTGRWADLGSGAGFPGLVLAHLHPDVAVDLVDSRQRRCAFLEEVVAHGPPRPAPLRVLCTRIEALPAGGYDGVTARALAPPSEALELAARLVVPGGAAVLLVAADSAPEHPQFEPVAWHPYTAGRATWVGRRR